MAGNNKTYKALRYITMLTQLGISVVSPLIMCVFVAIWFKNRFDFDDWIVLAGIMLGISSGFYSFWKYLKKFMAEMQREQEEYRKSLEE